MFWEECSGKREAFDVNVAARSLDEGLLSRAKALYTNLGGVIHVQPEEQGS